jgi:acyl-coenzyme A thioesterase PaaI-like protein
MTAHDILRIEPRFRGPARSGNGGYVTGLVGTALAAASADGTVPQVRLRVPPPLKVDLDLEVTTEGAQLTGPDGPIAAAIPVGSSTLGDATVDPVGHDEARAAEASYRGLAGHPFPTCFVCGPENAEGLQLRPGPIGDGRTACTWTPGSDLLAADELVDATYLWAALDCPGGWTIDLENRPSVLGQLTASIDARPPAGEACVVMGRLLAEDGRKTTTATTLYDADGRVLARAQQVWITVDPAKFT